ncbi:MAG: alginate lyase family protein [Vicinamibacteraceae bacterium]
MYRAAALSCCVTITAAVPAAFAAQPPSAFDALTAPQSTRPAALLLDPAYIQDQRARAQKGDAAITAAIAALEEDARKALALAPMSVLDKAITPPSGDKHDYVSQAPYWWPDPSKPDGKPYLRKDGQRNPEINKITDRDNLGRLGDAVATLALAYAYTGREDYATHAARLVRAWFLDPATRMNPHLQFGQYIPGINQGRGIGIIETRNLPELLDGVMLLSRSPAWTKADDDGLQAWMRAYGDWLVESTHGREESKNGNNHETWYDVQVAGLALYTGRIDVARRTIEGARARIAVQIEPDGRQPRELERTQSWHYSGFNLTAFMELATLGHHVGVDLWAYRTPDGRSLRQAVDFLVPYAAGERAWTFDQITPFSAATLQPILRRGAAAWKEPAYRALADRVGAGNPTLMLSTP